MSGNNPQDSKPAFVVLNYEQTQCVRFLLSLVHYDQMAQDIHDILPPALHVSFKEF